MRVYVGGGGEYRAGNNVYSKRDAWHAGECVERRFMHAHQIKSLVHVSPNCSVYILS